MAKEEVENRQVTEDGRRRDPGKRVAAWKEPGRRVEAAWKVQKGILAKLSLDARLPNISLQCLIFTARGFSTFLHSVPVYKTGHHMTV